VLRDAPPPVRVGAPRIDGDQFSAKLDRTNAINEVSLCYTTNAGPWQKRTWHMIPARVEDRQVRAELPATRPLVAFVGLKDEGGRYISSEHVELPER